MEFSDTHQWIRWTVVFTTAKKKKGLTRIIAILLIAVVPAVVAVVTDPAGIDTHGGGVARDQAFMLQACYLQL